MFLMESSFLGFSTRAIFGGTAVIGNDDFSFDLCHYDKIVEECFIALLEAWERVHCTIDLNNRRKKVLRHSAYKTKIETKSAKDINRLE